MSHFTTIKTKVTNAESLREAILLVGKPGTGRDFSPQYVTQGEAKPIFGYQGDDRSKLDVGSANYAPPCEVIIHRKTVSNGSNDIGFSRESDGTLAARISGFDSRMYNTDWLNKVIQRYQVVEATKAPEFIGWDFYETRSPTGDIQLTMRKASAKPQMAKL